MTFEIKFTLVSQKKPFFGLNRTMRREFTLQMIYKVFVSHLFIKNSIEFLDTKKNQKHRLWMCVKVK